MFTKVRCLYAVARYHPDPVTQQPRNIGVIVHCPEENVLLFRFLNDVQLETIMPKEDAALVEKYVADLERVRRAIVSGKEDKFLGIFSPLRREFLSEVAENLGERVGLLPPQPCITDDPSKEVDRLFSRLTSPPRRRPQAVSG